MNVEKLCIRYIMDTGDVSLLLKLKKEYFSMKSYRLLYNGLLAYQHRFSHMPTVDQLLGVLETKVSADQLLLLKSILVSPYTVNPSTKSSDLLAQIKDSYLLHETEKRLEELVVASQNKEVGNVLAILQEIHKTVDVEEKYPIDIQDAIYEPESIALTDPFLESMRAKNLKFGGLTLVGAKTGGGKSVFIVNQLNYDYKNGKNVALLNLELGISETISRLYCNATGEKFENIFGNPNSAIKIKVNDWLRTYYSGSNKFKLASAYYNTDEIERTVRGLANEGFEVIYVDYLQLVDATKNAKEWEALRDIVRVLHKLTQELGLIIISPVQVNVEDVKSTGVNVKIRGSRELEHSATVFLYLEKITEKDEEDEEEKGLLKIHTIKARNAEQHIYVALPKYEIMTIEDTGIVI